MIKENKKLAEHNLIQFLTGWGINDAHGLGKAIMGHFDNEWQHELAYLTDEDIPTPKGVKKWVMENLLKIDFPEEMVWESIDGEVPDYPAGFNKAIALCKAAFKKAILCKCKPSPFGDSVKVINEDFYGCPVCGELIPRVKKGVGEEEILKILSDIRVKWQLKNKIDNSKEIVDLIAMIYEALSNHITGREK